MRQDCPFLERSGENDDELCGIHSFKPSSCREWTPSLDRAKPAGQALGMISDSSEEVGGEIRESSFVYQLIG